jgi:hypothetical protein
MADKRPGWLQVPFVVEHVDRAAQSTAAEIAKSMHWWLSLGSSNQYESPLEVAFAIWWDVLQSNERAFSDSVFLHPQREVTCSSGRTYRVDMEIAPGHGALVREWYAEKGKTIQRVAVELDGHDFHERTKAQVELRNRRDRELQDDGWRVLHFSGSEFHRDPRACVTAAAKVALDQYQVAINEYEYR